MSHAAVIAGPPNVPDVESAGDSYLESVARRLRRNRLAVLGLYAIAGLIWVAIYAPLLAQNQPFYWNAGNGAEFPWFSALFNRLFFENAVDIFFNLILVASPIVAVVLWVLQRRSGKRERKVSVPKVLARSLLVVTAVFILTSVPGIGSFENPLHFTQKVVNYRAERDRLAEIGQAPVAVFPLIPYSYRETSPQKSLYGPGRDHWLGTDTEGRDVFSRMLYGTRISLTIGVVAVSIYVTIGVVLGALAGYFGGWVDNLVSRIIEIVITFPSFFLILTLAALIEQRSIFHVMVIIGVTSWTGVARLVRAEFLRQKSLDYVQAALAMGLGSARVIFFHILPNAIAPALVSATFGIASAILIESSLAFLGVGDLSVASWGETLNSGRTQQKLWLVVAPGVAIFFVVLIFNLVGEGIRDALDPKLRV